MQLIHASCVAVNGLAVLLRGPPGSGKSSLALRLIEAGATLVSDDYVALENQAGDLISTPPETIKGRIEARGVGLLKLNFLVQAKVRLLVDLVSRDEVERLPELETETIEGVAIRRLGLYAFDAATVAKIKIVLFQDLGFLTND